MIGPTNGKKWLTVGVDAVPGMDSAALYYSHEQHHRTGHFKRYITIFVAITDPNSNFQNPAQNNPVQACVCAYCVEADDISALLLAMMREGAAFPQIYYLKFSLKMVNIFRN